MMMMMVVKLEGKLKEGKMMSGKVGGGGEWHVG